MFFVKKKFQHVISTNITNWFMVFVKLGGRFKKILKFFWEDSPTIMRLHMISENNLLCGKLKIGFSVFLSLKLNLINLPLRSRPRSLIVIIKNLMLNVSNLVIKSNLTESTGLSQDKLLSFQADNNMVFWP